MDTGKLTPEDAPNSSYPPPSAQKSRYAPLMYTPQPYSYVPPAVAPTPAAPQPRKRSSMVMPVLLAGTLALGAVLGGAGAEAVMLANNSNALTATAPSSAATSEGLVMGTTGSDTIADNNTITIGSVYAKVSPSIVQITSVIASGSGRFSSSGVATGTGVILDLTAI